MFLTLTRKFGKTICVALYAVFAALAAKRNLFPCSFFSLCTQQNISLLAVRLQRKKDCLLLKGWPSVSHLALPGGFLLKNAEEMAAWHITSQTVTSVLQPFRKKRLQHRMEQPTLS